MARTMSQRIVGTQIDGIWHTGVVAFGYEYFYGGGIQSSHPECNQAGTAVQKIDMGTTSKTQQQLHDFLKSVAHQWTAQTYHLLQHNCNNFSDLVCNFLLGKPIPSFITGLPSQVLQTPMGSMIAGMYENMAKQGGGGSFVPQGDVGGSLNLPPIGGARAMQQQLEAKLGTKDSAGKQVRKVWNENKAELASSALSLVRKILANIATKPEQKRFQKLKTSVVKKKLGEVVGGVELLVLAGFEMNKEETHYEIKGGVVGELLARIKDIVARIDEKLPPKGKSSKPATVTATTNSEEKEKPKKIKSVTVTRNRFFVNDAEPDWFAQIQKIISAEKISSVVVEFPGNPLLQAADLRSLSELLRSHGIPLIVDDTVGSSLNFSAVNFADVIVTSLTKWFCGTGDVMAGSLALNPNSDYYDEFRKKMKLEYEDLVFSGDALALEASSRTYALRMSAVNASTKPLVEYLRTHPKVDKLWYPDHVTDPEICVASSTTGEQGHGGLFSFVLKDVDDSARFLEDLEVCKGPSLGTSYTLVCPYTMLAHYDELDWAEAQGISRYLIRVSTGMEDAEDLVGRFKRALNGA